MKKTLEQILGLSKQEQKLYDSLPESGNDGFTVAKIVQVSKLPRMTAHYILCRLLERGIVKRIKRNRHFLYERINIEDLFQDSLTLAGLQFDMISVPISEDSGITVHKGLKNIFLLHEKIAKQNKNNRVRTIQTSASTRRIVAGYSKKEIDQLHAFLSENHIICEDIVEEDFLDVAREEYGKDFEKALPQFLDRTSIAYILPKNFVTFENDMVLYRDVVVFIDWKSHVAVEIRDKETLKLCTGLFEAYKKTAQKTQYKVLASR